MKYRIVILSSGRATRQHTLSRIPGKFRSMVRLIVPKKEVDTYRLANPQAVVIGCPKTGIGATRQWVLEWTKADRLMMLDDDMYFYHRISKGDWHLATNSEKDNVDMLETLFGYLDEVPHAGMATRTEASFYLCDSRYCTRVNNVHVFDVEKMLRYGRKYGARFNVLPVMEDFHVTLTLLEKKIPNRVLLDYVWNQPGSNTDGGCSSYRTEELQAKAAYKLADLHPDYVKVVKKRVRGVTSWEGMKERTDVRIQWKEAYLAANSGNPHPHWGIELKSKRRIGE